MTLSPNPAVVRTGRKRSAIFRHRGARRTLLRYAATPAKETSKCTESLFWHSQSAEGGAPMSVLEKARRLFQEVGLALPEIPEELAAGLKEQGKWLFSTRDLEMSPYNLDHYVQEGDQAPAAYVVLAHSGHGVNSYAIQYYLVSGPLRLFLHLGWCVHGRRGSRVESPGVLFPGERDRGGDDGTEDARARRAVDNRGFRLLRQLLVRAGAEPPGGTEGRPRSVGGARGSASVAE